MSERISREEMLMGMAKFAAKRSTCERKQIGAVIAMHGRPLSIGYNGSPPGQPHCIDVGCLIDEKVGGCVRTLHAELNSIAYAARLGIAVDGADMFTTISPCKACADAIIAAGIKTVYFLERYRVNSIDYLIASGVHVRQLDDDPLMTLTF